MVLFWAAPFMVPNEGDGDQGDPFRYPQGLLGLLALRQKGVFPCAEEEPEALWALFSHRCPELLQETYHSGSHYSKWWWFMTTRWGKVSQNGSSG